MAATATEIPVTTTGHDAAVVRILAVVARTARTLNVGNHRDHIQTSAASATTFSRGPVVTDERR